MGFLLKLLGAGLSLYAIGNLIYVVVSLMGTDVEGYIAMAGGLYAGLLVLGLILLGIGAMMSGGGKRAA